MASKVVVTPELGESVLRVDFVMWERFQKLGYGRQRRIVGRSVTGDGVLKVVVQN